MIVVIPKACARLHRSERRLTVAIYGLLVPVDTLIFIRVIEDHGQILQQHAGWFVTVVVASAALSFTTFYLRDMHTTIRLRLTGCCRCR